MTNKKILTLITLLLVLFLLVGCDWFLSNRPPEIESVPVETATVGVDYTYNVIATDPDGDALDYFLTTEPEGMLIGESNGKITWKADDITAAGVGDYDVVVVVSDEGGLSDSQDFTIKVSEFVVELIKIEVELEETTLPLYTTGTLEVTAYYNDDTTPVVTGDCGYGSSNNSIATVEASKVTAVAEGTATITVTYKDKTDTIEVTVGEFVAMEIIADLPTFTVEKEAEFTVKIVANSDVDKNVMFYFTLPDGDYTLGYYVEAIEEWISLSPVEGIGVNVVIGGTGYSINNVNVPQVPLTGFALIDEEVIFEATFATAGTYLTTVEVRTLLDDVLLNYEVIAAEVVPAE